MSWLCWSKLSGECRRGLLLLSKCWLLLGEPRNRRLLLLKLLLARESWLLWSKSWLLRWERCLLCGEGWLRPWESWLRKTWLLLGRLSKVYRESCRILRPQLTAWQLVRLLNRVLASRRAELSWKRACGWLVGGDGADSSCSKRLRGRRLRCWTACKTSGACRRWHCCVPGRAGLAVEPREAGLLLLLWVGVVLQILQASCKWFGKSTSSQSFACGR